MTRHTVDLKKKKIGSMPVRPRWRMQARETGHSMRVLSMIVAGERQAAKPYDISDIRSIRVDTRILYRSDWQGDD